MQRDWAELVQLRGRIKGSISRLAAYAEKPPADCQPEDVGARLDRLHELWEEFSIVTTAMYKYCNDEDYSDPDTDFAIYEEKVMSARGKLRALRLSVMPSNPKEDCDTTLTKLADQQSKFLEQVSTVSIAKNEVKTNNLPKIVIPPFSGQYKAWPTFKDLFISAIHTQPNLTNAQKFHYLKSLLKEDAALILTHIPITETSYTTAWNRLNERYDRPRHIVASFIESFMSLTAVTQENAQGLRKISDGANEVIRGLDAISRGDRDCWLIHLLETKLDPESRQKWIERSKDDNAPTIETFFKFLDLRCEELELAQTKPLKPNSSTNGRTRNSRSFLSTDSSRSMLTCIKCGSNNHTLGKCSSYLGLSLSDRRSLIKDKSLCFNCLCAGHILSTCKSKFRCKRCNLRHHTSLHVNSLDSPHQPQPQTISTADVVTSAAELPSKGHWSTVSHVSHPTLSFVDYTYDKDTSVSALEVPHKNLLPTAVVDVQTNFGNFIPCRLLLDSGSELSYISENFAQRLNLRRTHSRILVSGIISTKSGTTRGCLSVFLKSRVSSNSLFAQVHVLSNITAPLPAVTTNRSLGSELNNIALADPSFNESLPIDILLGSQYVWKVFDCKKKVDAFGNPIAISTIFGWVVTSIAIEKDSPSTTSFLTTVNIDRSLQKFWEIEEVDFPKCIDPDDALVEEHFLRTMTRESDGKYTVELPFRENIPTFSDTLQGALTRFYSMEKRLSRNPSLKLHYIEFMRQYEALGHMCEIQPRQTTSVNASIFYIPHHPVLGQKLRVVFDGSFADSNGRSLNSALHAGPNIYRNLFAVCLKFRLHRFVFTADIVKMFRQIWVAKHHRDFQRIIWREDPSLPLKHYQLCTVTYGTACAPFLAVRVLQQIAQDYKTTFPRGSRILLEDFYVDDVLTGADSETELLQLRDELVHLLKMAGMELSKWVSNSTKLGQELTAQHEIFSEEVTKVLGLYWKPNEDILTYTVQTKTQSTVNKRQILSDVSRLFDPLGLLAPIVVRFKIMFQLLWLQNLSWDEALPPNLAETWTRYHQDLSQPSKIKIDRFVPNHADKIEIHAFSDASTKAYAAAVYLRFEKDNGESSVSLLAAKTRVAPLKTISLPRLELSGALLLARLVKLILEIIPHRETKVYAWCDSTIVLSWLSIPPTKLKTFVGNRTSEILTILPRSIWHHIISKDNPADCASRGMSAALLRDFDLWWKGPSWLRNKNELNEVLEKSSRFTFRTNDDVSGEMKTNTISMLTTEAAERNVFDCLIERLSSWQRLLRTTAYVLRFINHARKPAAKTTSVALVFNEICTARNVILRHIQGCFRDEVQALKLKKEVSRNSQILKLAPFLDDNGILRVGGRISQSVLCMETKHPIILPKLSKVTHLLLVDEHNRNLHPGVSALFVIVRQRYWVLGARNLIRKITYNCTKCFRLRQSSMSQLMADLPQIRVRQAFPFQHSGVDYAGPIILKLYRGRNARQSKGYICIFVCLATSAIHIELASDLSTDCFLSALRRFMARRGKCTQIFSDNGRNFVGASRVLSEMHQLVNSQQHNDIISEALAHDGIRWNFIPPHAPHWGGVWESAVRSVKLHLRRVIGNSVLTAEQLNTLLIQIEAVVNSRPIGVNPDSDINYLSPSHFLIGRPLTMVTEGSLQDINENKLDYWQHIQNMYQGFWRRWHQEYLTSLQNRPKWKRRTKNVVVGDIVIIKEPNTPPAVWPMGRVLETFPGTDGLVRVVKLRTVRGELIRPITKVVILPTSETVFQRGPEC